MSSAKSSQLVYSTVDATWKWMWPDTLMRVLPMAIVPLLYVGIFHLPLSSIGLSLYHVPMAIAVGLIVGIAMAAFAIFYRMCVVGPWFRRPTGRDQSLQTFFYLFINAPAEELFFRGFLLTIIAQLSHSLLVGWLISTAAYTLYHKLGKWSWRSVGGVGLAGLVFSLVYLLLPGPRSLLAVIIVHGLTTCGFLSWGDEALYRRWHWVQNKETVA